MTNKLGKSVCFNSDVINLHIKIISIKTDIRENKVLYTDLPNKIGTDFGAY
ncbi:hypothetical protein SFSGTM_08480 [Sulfuriferula nivalis]|uniref:Uncharacterized protein n=1 Tax=Sulfuriferula nivalis TaxID=2675298 RepID=A0A809SGR1_9PROT|nr:hypothetical protein SFSGTM_08480 [Sulfuriferula nivalis]